MFSQVELIFSRHDCVFHLCLDFWIFSKKLIQNAANTQKFIYLSFFGAILYHNAPFLSQISSSLRLRLFLLV